MKKIMFSVLITFLFACASPQKSFKKGNYSKAFEQSLKQLKNGKAERRDRQILNKSFRELVSEYKNENVDYLSSNLIEDWEVAYSNSEDIIKKYVKSKRYLDDNNINVMLGVEEDTKQLRKDIAVNYWDLANESMLIYSESEDKRAAQDAYLMFAKVDNYSDNNDYPDIDILSEEALELGTIRILIETETWEFSTEWLIDQEFNDIERVRTNEFTEIYFERNVQDLDCRIIISFSNLDIDERTNISNERFSEEIIDGYQTVTDTSGVSRQEPIYKTVNGSVRIDRVERSFRWRARTKIDGNINNCDFREQTFDAVEKYTEENYEISGDARAVPDAYKQRNVRSDDDEIMDSLIEDIYLQFKRYYF